MSEWVKCSDKLPDDCDCVLIYCPITHSQAVAYLIYDIDRIPITFIINDFDESDQTIHVEDISHWMKLPPPPKKMHCCHIHANFFCMENIYNELIIKEDLSGNDIPEYPCLPVNYCPVCGTSADGEKA